MPLKRTTPMQLKIETELEDDGRWIASIPALPGCHVYGDTMNEALARVKALALRVVAERIEDGEIAPHMASVAFSEAS